MNMLLFYNFLKLWLNPSMNIPPTLEHVGLTIAWLVLSLANSHSVQIICWLFFSNNSSYITLLCQNMGLSYVLLCITCINNKTNLIYSLITRRLNQISCKAMKGPYVWVLWSKIHLRLSISSTFYIFPVHNYFIAFICIFNGFLLGTLIKKNKVKPDFSLGNFPYFLKIAREGRRLKF